LWSSWVGDLPQWDLAKFGQELKKGSKKFWVSLYKMATCWSLLCKYGDLRPFCPCNVAVLGIEILLDFLYFCHFVTCLLQLHILADLFSSFSYFSISFHLSHMTMPRDVLSFIKFKNSKYIRWIEIILVYYYKLELCFEVWMLYKLVCEYLVNMLLKHLICIHTLAHLTIYGLIVIQLLLWYFLIGILIQIYS